MYFLFSPVKLRSWKEKSSSKLMNLFPFTIIYKYIYFVKIKYCNLKSSSTISCLGEACSKRSVLERIGFVDNRCNNPVFKHGNICINSIKFFVIAIYSPRYNSLTVISSCKEKSKYVLVYFRFFAVSLTKSEDYNFQFLL